MMAEAVKCKIRLGQRSGNLGVLVPDPLLLGQFLRKTEIEEMESFKQEQNREARYCLCF